MKVRKAVIVAAGMGTRMLPASKVIPKEMLPLVDKPAIQIVVEEIVASGIDDIILVLSPGRTTVLEHFRPAPELEKLLASRGKNDLLVNLRRLETLARFNVAEQREPLGLGHAVLQARAAVGAEPFAVVLPDDIFDGARPCLGQLLEVAEKEDAPVVALNRVAKDDLAKYGIVAATPLRPRVHQLTGMIEKPSIDQAPSDLAIMGRYVLTPDIFPLLAAGRPGAGGEIQLTDGLLALSQRRRLLGYEFEGVRYDLGDRAGFIAAQVGFGLKRPELAPSLRAYLRSVVSS